MSNANTLSHTNEQWRLSANNVGQENWKRWGPYLSERQWGTVREDYSAHGNAWDYFPHDHARSRAYRWGEDGVAGFSDDQQHLCLSLALWNGQDSILKERMFGLTNGEGNHGEDVKDLYYYLDATPTHSYMKMLYKYPQQAFPYEQLLQESRSRNQDDPEFELIDTGVFDDNRYFDVYIEYAQASPGDVLMNIRVHNRANQPAELSLLPQLCFRNTWSWSHGAQKPSARKMSNSHGVQLQHPEMDDYYWYVSEPDEWLFTENETNNVRLYEPGEQCGNTDKKSCAREQAKKDAFHHYVVDGHVSTLAGNTEGTKVAGLKQYVVPALGQINLRVRLSPTALSEPFAEFEHDMDTRRTEADEFYQHLQQGIAGADEKLVQRQAFAGMIWTKQFYNIDMRQWMSGDSAQPAPPASRKSGRNSDWMHLSNAHIISMPDKWEYPWYAAWDSAFHCIPLAMIDAEFAKDQLVLFTREGYIHPNGQIPAYEWAFGDVNPPVHAWATWRVYQMDKKQQKGKADIAFLETVFHKLILNFNWWVNRKDIDDNNIFQGGFLGLDNIGLFDRSAPLPTGGHINQADGTSWMAMYSLNMMRIAIELALHNAVYEEMAIKFFEHFLHIAESMTNLRGKGIGLWDEEDQFYYDELILSHLEHEIPMKVRSMVGLIPLYAVEVLDFENIDKLPAFKNRLQRLLNDRPELHALVACWQSPGRKERRLLSLVTEQRLRAVLSRMLDETEFLSDYGIRALSKQHRDQPYSFNAQGVDMQVQYEPAESKTHLFGGNSNWRGPIWFPVNYLLIESLQKFHHYYGNNFKVECPTGSNVMMNLEEVAAEISKRLSYIFLADASGKRAVYGHHAHMQNNEHFKDNILFYEYFHGDSGRGVGANHQTGWTGLIAKLLHPRPLDN